MSSLLIINPLGRALAHYAAELEDVLRTRPAGVHVETIAFPEPSAGTAGRAAWLKAYLAALVQARRSSSQRVIVVWPVLGYLDVVLVRLIIGRRAAVVIHDTDPLVRSVGYGWLSRCLASLFLSRATIIIHSPAARRDLRWRRLRQRALQLPHPILAPRKQIRPLDQGKVVRTLGQFKPDRDLDALRTLEQSALAQHRLEIVGRGWPEVDGWEVSDQFVSEDELTRLIDTSDVVLIPYRRFNQSGIAIRCLERGVPIVGPSDSSLSDLFGRPSRLLVPTGTDEADLTQPWVDAVQYALAEGSSEAEYAARRWRGLAIERWGHFADEASRHTTRKGRP